MFSTAGEFAGAVVEEDGRRAIVPAERFLAVADDLLARRDAPPAGRLGLSIAPLTPALARATGVTFGVVVTDVAQDTGSNDLRAGDIVTAVNDRTVRSLSEWHAATAVIAAGATATLRVTDGVNTRDVVVMAHEPAAARPGLGARFARVAGGSRLLAVEAGTAVDRAGLVTGDLITRAGTISAPTPSQITRLFAEHQNGLLIAFTRGGRHQVTALVP